MYLDEYINKESDPEDDYLYRLWRATNIHTVHGRMASGHLQGRLLKMFVMMQKPQYILEVGTFSGYSAICMAEGLKELSLSKDSLPLAPSKGGGKGLSLVLPQGEGKSRQADTATCQSKRKELITSHTDRSFPPLGGGLGRGLGSGSFPPLGGGLGRGPRLFTFEINDEMEDFTRPWIEGSPVAEYIDFRIGDAITEAPKLGVKFDMAFVDGDKRTYVETYDAIFPLMNEGGIILADNTLWDGHVIDPAYDHDSQTIGIRRFNDYIAKDHRVEKVIIPIRDGLTVIRKK